jgi:hypothetical protein
MALLSSRGISTPSLQAQGGQRRSSYFNNDRDIAARRGISVPGCLIRAQQFLISAAILPNK